MKTIWAGRVISGLIVLPFLMGIVMTLSGNPDVAKGMEQMGIPATLQWPLFAVELLCIIAYAIPQTAVLGAILLTGYMGGAILTHLRIGDTAHVPIPVVIGMLAWLGLYLRDARLRDLLPLRKSI